MRKKITLSFYAFLLVFAACKKEDTFPKLNENLQAEAYIKNKVSSYVVSSKPGSSPSSKDSVLINENGLPTTHFTSFTMNDKTSSSIKKITYDSINRIKEYSVEGEFPHKMKMKYRKDDKQKIVFTDMGGEVTHYQFDNDFKNLKRSYHIDNTSTDTTSDFYYKYKNGKISSVSKKSKNKWTPIVEYVYNGEKLKLVKTKYGTTYFSQKTGLADSSSIKQIYKYYYR